MNYLQRLTHINKIKQGTTPRAKCLRTLINKLSTSARPPERWGDIFICELCADIDADYTSAISDRSYLVFVNQAKLAAAYWWEACHAGD